MGSMVDELCVMPDVMIIMTLKLLKQEKKGEKSADMDKVFIH